MRNMQLIFQEYEVRPLLHAVQVHPELWNQNTLRTGHPGTAHGDVDDIWLWFNKTDDPEKVVDDKQVEPYAAWYILPQAHRVIADLMHRVRGVQLGRVIITRLAPGKRIAPHVDGGAPADYFERYQVALQSLPGAMIRVGNEEVSFCPGEIWHIDNKQEHEVANNSADDRIVMIVDIRVP